jgi:preprotein translocase subunit Sss1
MTSLFICIASLLMAHGASAQSLFPETLGSLEGVQMILTMGATDSSTRRRLQATTVTDTEIARCDALWAKGVSLRMQKQAEMALVDFESVDFTLGDIQKEATDNQVTYDFDVIASIHSAVTDLNMTQYVQAPFASPESQTAFMGFLKRTGCAQFQSVETLELVVPATSTPTTTTTTPATTTTTPATTSSATTTETATTATANATTTTTANTTNTTNTTTVVAKAKPEQKEISNGIVYTLAAIVLIGSVGVVGFIFSRPILD